MMTAGKVYTFHVTHIIWMEGVGKEWKKLPLSNLVKVWAHQHDPVMYFLWVSSSFKFFIPLHCYPTQWWKKCKLNGERKWNVKYVVSDWLSIFSISMSCPQLVLIHFISLSLLKALEGPCYAQRPLISLQARFVGFLKLFFTIDSIGIVG